MIVLEQDTRNHAILHVLYAAGLRVSELCNLRWRHVVRRENGVQLDIVSGKGDMTPAPRAATGGILAHSLGHPRRGCGHGLRLSLAPGGLTRGVLQGHAAGHDDRLPYRARVCDEACEASLNAGHLGPTETALTHGFSHSLQHRAA
jgi:integrase